MLLQAFVAVLGLRVVDRRDEPVEDLPGGERELGRVGREDVLDLAEQLARLCARVVVVEEAARPVHAALLRSSCATRRSSTSRRRSTLAKASRAACSSVVSRSRTRARPSTNAGGGVPGAGRCSRHGSGDSPESVEGQPCCSRQHVVAVPPMLGARFLAALDARATLAVVADHRRAVGAHARPPRLASRLAGVLDGRRSGRYLGRRHSAPRRFGRAAAHRPPFGYQDTSRRALGRARLW